jgi:hypothetical protein
MQTGYTDDMQSSSTVLFYKSTDCPELDKLQYLL